MKNLFYLVWCLLAFSGTCAHAGEASYTTNTQVELVGTFGADVGLDANDNKEHYYYLKLDQPIHVVDTDYGENEDGVVKIQLALGDGSEKFSSRPYKGKRIMVTGSLYHSHTAHHHTRILMFVNKVGDLRLVASP